MRHCHCPDPGCPPTPGTHLAGLLHIHGAPLTVGAVKALWVKLAESGPLIKVKVGEHSVDLHSLPPLELLLQGEETGKEGGGQR